MPTRTYRVQWCTDTLESIGIKSGSEITVEDYTLNPGARSAPVAIKEDPASAPQPYVAAIDLNRNLIVDLGEDEATRTPRHLLMSETNDPVSGEALIYGEAVVGDPEGTGGFGGHGGG